MVRRYSPAFYRIIVIFLSRARILLRYLYEAASSQDAEIPREREREREREKESAKDHPSSFQASRKSQRDATRFYSLRDREVSLYKYIFCASRRNILTLHRSFCLSVTENNDDRIGCIAAGGDTRDTTSSSTP